MKSGGERILFTSRSAGDFTVTIDLPKPLEIRLTEIAKIQSLTTTELIKHVLTEYAAGRIGESMAWVKTTQSDLASVWPPEDFSDWNPPHDAQTE